MHGRAGGSAADRGRRGAQGRVVARRGWRGATASGIGPVGPKGPGEGREVVVVRLFFLRVAFDAVGKVSVNDCFDVPPRQKSHGSDVRGVVVELDSLVAHSK